jgi:hypothetical protein
MNAPKRVRATIADRDGPVTTRAMKVFRRSHARHGMRSCKRQKLYNEGSCRQLRSTVSFLNHASAVPSLRHCTGIAADLIARKRQAESIKCSPATVVQH